MLYEVNAPMPPMVHDTVMKNIGSLENKGWEFELGGDIVRSKNFRYTSSLRLSHNKSKIKRLGDDGYFLDQVTFPSPATRARPCACKTTSRSASSSSTSMPDSTRTANG